MCSRSLQRCSPEWLSFSNIKMVFCMALGCNNQSKRRLDLSFYRLPLKNEELLTRWLVNLRKPKLPQLLRNCYVCSDHFEPDCFGRDLKAELLGERPKPPLVTDAVPTLFLYNDFKGDRKRRVTSERRRIKKEKEQILKELLGPEYHDMRLIPPELIPEVTNEDVYVDDKFSIQSLLPGFGRISEISCQTDDKPTTEMSCQTDRPSLVTTGTQWTEKDFVPDRQVIEQEHTYCKKSFESVACQVETLSLPITRAAKTRISQKGKILKTKRKMGTKKRKKVKQVSVGTSTRD